MLCLRHLGHHSVGVIHQHKPYYVLLGGFWVGGGQRLPLDGACSEPNRFSDGTFLSDLFPPGFWFPSRGGKGIRRRILPPELSPALPLCVPLFFRSVSPAP